VGNSFNNVPAPGDTTTASAPADQPTFGAPGTVAPGAKSLYGAYGLLADAAGENIDGNNVSTEPTGPNDPEVTNSSGQQIQPGPGASGFIDRATGLTNESPYLSGSPGETTGETALVAPGSSLAYDSKINADDTGRLVSGTGIPNDTFVGAVSDTGPVSLTSNSSISTASNNYAKPWIGTFQLLNDSGQPVTLTSGFSGPITLGAEGATSTIGTSTCTSTNEAATTSGCVTADPLYDPTDFTPGGGDTGTVLISPLIKPGTVTGTYYNHYSTLRTLEDLLLTGQTCTNPKNADTPLVAGTVCGGLDGAGHIGYAAQSGLADFGPDVFTAVSFQPVGPPPGYSSASGFGDSASSLYCPIVAHLGRPGQDGQDGHGSNGGAGGTGGSPGCGTDGGNGGDGGNGANFGGNGGDGNGNGNSGHVDNARHDVTATGSGGTGGNGGNGACPAEEWNGGVWLTATGAATTPVDTPPCNGLGGDGGNGGNGGNGVGSKSGGNGGNGGNGSPGQRGTNGTNGANG
ncbi:MAG: hypothetical protein WCA31_05640, partial [Acidimicrobiales bacterium]